MKIYLDVDTNGFILGHYCERFIPKPIDQMVLSKYSPEQLFDTEAYGYKYKYLNGEFIDITEEEFYVQPFRKKNLAIMEVQAKAHEKKKKDEAKELEKLLPELEDQHEIDACNKRIAELNSYKAKRVEYKPYKPKAK